MRFFLGTSKKSLAACLGKHAQWSKLQDREDLLQDIAANLLDTQPTQGRMIYGVIKVTTLRFLRQKNTAWKRYSSLDATVLGSQDNEDPKTLVDFLVAEVEYEDRIQEDVDRRRLLRKFPDRIICLVGKIQGGLKLSKAERVAMAMVSKGITLGELNRSEDAIAAYDEVVKRFGKDREPVIKELVKRALDNKKAVQKSIHAEFSS